MTSGSGANDAEPHVDPWVDALAAELRAEMARQQLSQEEYARRSGIPLVSIQRYVSGTRDIPMRRFPALCRGLGVPMEEMLSRVVSALDRSGETGTERQSS